MVITEHVTVRRSQGRVASVHRVSAASTAVLLAVFGVLGLTARLGSLETMGAPVLGLTTNGVLSLSR